MSEFSFKLEEKVNENEPKCIKRLFENSSNGQVESLVSTLENDFSLKTIDTALRKCLRNRKEPYENYNECTKLLMTHYSNINFKNENEKGSTILMIACLKCDFNLLSQYIITDKTNYLEQDSQKNTFIHYLINKNNKENEIINILNYVNDYLERSAKENKKIDLNHENDDGFTPLAYSLILGYSNLAQYLILKGADKNHIIKSNGDTMIHCAVIGKNKACVNLIFDNNSLILKKNKVSMNAIDKCDQESDQGIKSLLLARIGKNFLKDGSILTHVISFKDNQKFSDKFNKFLLFIYLRNNNRGNFDNLQKFISENELEQIKIYFRDFDLTRFYERDLISMLISMGENLKNLYLNYNYSLILFKSFSYEKLFSAIRDQKFYKENFEVYFNSTLIFIEVSIHYQFYSLSDLLIKDLEEMLNSKIKKETSNQKITEYFNSIELIHKEFEGLTCVLLLFKAYRFLAELKFEEAKSELKQYKNVYFRIKNKSLPVFQTLSIFYITLKIRLNCQNNNTIYNKFHRHFKKIESKQKKESFESQIYFLNTNGIMLMKTKKYNLAEFYFKNLINRINNCSKNEKFESKSVNLIYTQFNLALSYFFQKKYSLALEIYKLLSKHLPLNPFIWYRLGLCTLELYLTKNKNRNNYCDIVEKITDFTAKSNSMNQENLKEVKKIILKSLIIRNKATSQDSSIDEAIYYFRQTILVLSHSSSGILTNLNEIISPFEDKNKSKKENFQSQIKSIKFLYNSSYLNLAFCLLTKEEWTQALSIIKIYEKSEFFEQSNTYLIENYKIQCYIYLNKINEALEIINNSKENISDFKITPYIKHSFYSEVKYKVSLYCNIFKLQMLHGNLNEGERMITEIFKCLGIKLNLNEKEKFCGEVPCFVINILIYYFLSKNDINSAIRLIQKKRIILSNCKPLIGLNK